MNRRKFLKGLLGAAALATLPIPPLNRKIRSIIDDFEIDTLGNIRFVGGYTGADANTYTVQELYEYIKDQGSARASLEGDHVLRTSLELEDETAEHLTHGTVMTPTAIWMSVQSMGNI